MKRILTLLMILAAFVGVMTAQTTPKLSYQAVIRDGANNLVHNKAVTVEAVLLQDGVAVYRETLEGVTNTNGMLSVTLGAMEQESAAPVAERPQASPLELINWNRPTFMRMVVTYDEGSTVIEEEVHAVPYALTAGFLLTTDKIVRYLNPEVTSGEDVKAIYAALTANTDVFEAIVDSVVNYVKANYAIAKQIAFHYAHRVTPADVNEAYEEFRSLDPSVKQAIYDIVKDYLKNHRNLAMEMAKFYIGRTSGSDVQRLYNKLVENTRVYAYVEGVLDGVLDEYLRGSETDPACLTDNGFRDLCDLWTVAGEVNIDPNDSCPAVFSIRSSASAGLGTLYENRGIIMTGNTKNFNQKVTGYGFYYSTNKQAVESHSDAVKQACTNHAASANARFGSYTYKMDNTDLCGDTIYYCGYVTLNTNCPAEGGASVAYTEVKSYVVPDYKFTVVKENGTYKLVFDPSVARAAFAAIYDPNDPRPNAGSIKWYDAGGNVLYEGLEYTPAQGAAALHHVTANLKDCDHTVTVNQ